MQEEEELIDLFHLLSRKGNYNGDVSCKFCLYYILHCSILCHMLNWPLDLLLDNIEMSHQTPCLHIFHCSSELRIHLLNWPLHLLLGNIEMSHQSTF